MYRLTVHGRPATKKTSQVIAKRANGRPFVLGAKRSRRWEAMAVEQLRHQWAPRRPLEGPLLSRVVVHRAERRGDLTNYVEAVHDALQRAGVIQNDSQILELQAIMGHDRDHPRVEIGLLVIPNGGTA